MLQNGEDYRNIDGDELCEEKSVLPWKRVL